MSVASRRLRICVAVLACGLSACGHMPKPEGAKPEAAPEIAPSKPAGVVDRAKAAMRFAEQGRLADALVEWKILRTIDPQNRRYRDEVRQTATRIDTLVTQRMRAGNAAIEKGDAQTARREYLAALALAPASTEALEKLRGLEFERVWGTQSAKLEKLKSVEERKAETASEQERFYFELGTLMFRQGDYAGAIREIQKYLNSYPNDAQARKILGDAHAKLAATQREQGQLQEALDNMEQAKRIDGNKSSAPTADEKEVRMALADEYYEKGLRARATDLALAIDMWRKAIEYNPDHAKAKLRLKEALRMQKNLQKIGK